MLPQMLHDQARLNSELRIGPLSSKSKANIATTGIILTSTQCVSIIFLLSQNLSTFSGPFREKKN